MLRPTMMNNTFADSLFDEFFNDSFWPTARPVSTATMMKSDVRENEHDYQIDMELPGFAKEDVHADLQDGYLTIHAEHNDTTEEKDEKGKYLRRERYTGSCRRRFYVGDNVTQADIKAKFADGVLTMTVPKKDPAQVENKKEYIAIEG